MSTVNVVWTAHEPIIIGETEGGIYIRLGGGASWAMTFREANEFMIAFDEKLTELEGKQPA